MKNFRFQNATDMRFGTGRLDTELHDAVSRFGSRVLFVYGGHSIKKSGLYDTVKGLLADLDVTELAGIEPNPKIASIREGQQLAKQHDIDVVLAVGGGSVIDAAKVIASAKFYDGDPWDLVKDRGITRHKLQQVPVVDILTLAATGSEMNSGSVISNPATHEKLGTTGPNTPAISFLDPSLTYTVPVRQTAAGSMDILSHLIEQYFDRSKNNDASKGMMEGLMRTVIKWAPIAVKEPHNPDARANLMWSATMALNGLVSVANENGWTVHSLEHELSAYYDITHGVGLGILTPRWMEFILTKDPTTAEMFARFGRHVWDLEGDETYAVAQAAIDATFDWIQHLGFPMTLPEVGIADEKHFDAMATAAVANASLETRAYVPLSEEDVKAIYQASMTNGLTA